MKGKGFFKAINSDIRLIIYEKNKPRVLSALRNGEIDYVDLTSWSFLDEFFGYLFGIKFFESIAEGYPSPRKREGIPLWFLIAAYMQLKLHTEEAFMKLPFVLRSGSILCRVGANLKVESGGFNNKNKKKRLCPIDQDTVRKFFKDTEPGGLEQWYNHDVVRFFRSHKGVDEERIFILDSSLLPLPPNENYENASWVPLDEDGHYVNEERLSGEQKSKVKPTLCYNLVTLMNISFQADYFIFMGAHLGPGKESGLKEGEKLVDGYIERFGRGSIKTLIMDRGFIDGGMIRKFKKEYKIDVVIPLKVNMDAYIDALGISKLSEVKWVEVSIEEEGKGGIQKREVAGIYEITSWENCEVPLHVVLIRDTDKNGEVKVWALASTKHFDDPMEIVRLYGKRSQIEERYKQLKLFWYIYAFTSTAFSLVAAHVFFILLAYSALEFYLRRKNLQHLACRTIKTLQYEEQLGRNAVIAYWKSYYATFDVIEYQNILLNLTEVARKKLSRRTKELLHERNRSP